MSSSAGLEQSYQLIKPRMEAMDRLLGETFRSEVPCVDAMLDYARRYSGKKLRPALVFLIGTICGDCGPRHVRLGAVVEMIHLATLVHDDVLDRATLRRNAASVNANWNDKDAILLGDVIFARAIRLLVALESPRALDLLTGAVSTLCEGEIHQNDLAGDPGVDEDTYGAIIRKKTASLYAAACELAANFAGASPEQVEAFAEFGAALGEAFQIADDCLDLTGDEAVVGKSLGTDIRNGKMTLPLIRLLAELGEADRREVQALIRSRAATPEQVARLRDRLVAHGIIEKIFATAETLVDASLARLRKLLDPDAHALLVEIAGFVVHRRH